MSRISLHRPRHNRAVWDRPATDTRLLPIPFPNTVSPAVPLSADGRSTDFTRQTPSQGLCRYNAPSYGRFGLADFTLAEDKPASFDAFARALEPFHDSSNRSHPSIPFGAPRHRVVTPSLSSVERCSRTDMPHTETPSNLARLLRHVWGFRRLAADVQHPLRRTIGVGAGVVVFLRNSHGPSIASAPNKLKPKLNQRRHPAPLSPRGSSRNLERGIPLLGDGPLIPSQIRRGGSPVEGSSEDAPGFLSRSIKQARAFDCNNQKALKS